MSDKPLAADTQATDLTALLNDARLDDMLERVSFQPGVMLGSEALTAEQEYNLRRLTRHQRWLTGPGTLFGLRVDAAAPPLAGGGTDLTLNVSPGYAIDGLGREVVVSETYSLSLIDWLAAQNAAGTLAGFYNSGVLYLRVTIRAQPCPTGLQPVVAELFDSGLDPVVPARVGDAFLLEVLGDANQIQDTPPRPLDTWSPDHTTPATTDLPGSVSSRETATLAAITDPAAHAAMNLQAWLLRRTLPPFDDSPGTDAVRTEAARLLLASVHVALATLTTTPALADTQVNNLVRPFVRPNVLLAPLSLP
jgi:hypothetical protein